MNIISTAIRQIISVAETWLSRKTRPAITTRMPMNGRKPKRNVFIFEPYSAIKCANIRISANFAISDGWNSMPPMLIHRFAPFLTGAIFVPLNASTMPKSTTAMPKTMMLNLCRW